MALPVDMDKMKIPFDLSIEYMRKCDRFSGGKSNLTMSDLFHSMLSVSANNVKSFYPLRHPSQVASVFSFGETIELIFGILDFFLEFVFYF